MELVTGTPYQRRVGKEGESYLASHKPQVSISGSWLTPTNSSSMVVFPKECSMNHYAMEQMRGPDRPFIQFLVLVDNRVSPVLDLVISDRFPTFGLATYSIIALLPIIYS